VATAALMKTLRQLVAGRRIIVPPIQRNFAWKVGNTSKDPTSSQSTKLLEDLENFHKLRKENYVGKYFLGNIIAVVDEHNDLYSEENEWSLLDGQQRITSLSLMMQSIHYRLDMINTMAAKELQNDLDKSWLKLDTTHFTDELHPYPIKHRRLEDQYCFKNYLRGNIEDIPRDSNMGNVAFSYYNHFKKKNLLELKGFLKTVLDHVIVSVTLTDSMTMGYQMFQTANARGLSLSAYDMFRAFVVKKIEADFKIKSSMKLLLHQILNQLEDVFQVIAWGADEKKREKNLKSFITAYMIIRSGNNLRESTIINYIEREIHEISNGPDLINYLQDMIHHAMLWRKEIHPGRPVDRTAYKFKMIRRFHRLGFKKGNSAYLSFVGNVRPIPIADWLLSVVEWAVFKQLLKHGALAGKTEIFSKISSDVNLFWQREYNQEHCTDFRTKWLVEEIEGDELNTGTFPIGENPSYALLHYLEPIEGFSSSDPGRNSRTTSIIRLGDEDAAGDAYDEVGNFFLIPGLENNGWGTTQTHTHNDSRDYNKRIEDISRMTTTTEHNMHTELLQLVDRTDFREFIKRRTKKINELLNKSYKQFMQQEPSSF